MSTPLAVSCPHCGAGLKLKNNNFVGKKVPCPKCKKPFLVEEPPEDEFLSEDDDFGATDDMEEEEEAEAPRSKGKSSGGSKSAKGKGKKKSKSGGGFAPMAMIGGGVVLGLGLIAGIVYGAISLFSGGSSLVKWLPDDTEMVIQVRVADSMNAPLFKPIMDHPTLSKLMNQPGLTGVGQSEHSKAFMQTLGVQAKDIDTFTIGIMNQMSANVNSPPAFVAVIRLKTPLDESKLSQAPATTLTKEDHNGKAVYAVVESANPRVLIHAVNSMTYLLGSDAELKAAIDSKGKAPAQARYSFANDKSNVLIVMAPKDTTKFQSDTKGSFGPTGMMSGDRAFNSDGMQSLSVEISLGSDAKMELRTVGSEANAKANVDDMKELIEKQKQSLRTAQAQLAQPAGLLSMVPAAAITKILGNVDTMLAGAQVTSEGSNATLTMTLSGQIVKDGVELTSSPLVSLYLANMVAEQEKAAATAAAAATKSTLGNSPMDITAYPGAVIDAGEKSKTKINDLNDQHNADLQAQMQEGGAANDPAKSMHASMAAGAAAAPAGNVPAGNDPAKAMHAVPALAPAAGNEAANDPAKAMHAAAGNLAPAGNDAAAANDPAKAMRAAAGAGNAAGNGQNADKPAEKPANKSRSRRKP